MQKSTTFDAFKNIHFWGYWAWLIEFVAFPLFHAFWLLQVEKVKHESADVVAFKRVN